MTPQAYKDEVQPVEKAPADVEQTNGAFQVPPPHGKPIAYKVLFTLGFVCFGMALLSFLSVSSWEARGEFEGFWWLIIATFSFATFVSGLMLLASGLIIYLTDRKSR